MGHWNSIPTFDEQPDALLAILNRQAAAWRNRPLGVGAGWKLTPLRRLKIDPLGRVGGGVWGRPDPRLV
jgi:hypothetical protein